MRARFHRARAGLDKGTYNITGAVAGTNNACGFQAGNPVGGYIIYPGAGQGGFALAIPFFTAPAQVTIANAFPAVPAAGPTIRRISIALILSHPWDGQPMAAPSPI